MPIIIKTRKHYFTRFPIGLLIILFFGLSPFIIGISGGFLTELITGKPCHEGNCFWGVLPWLGFFTLPISGILLIVYAVIIAFDSFKLSTSDPLSDYQ